MPLDGSNNSIEYLGRSTRTRPSFYRPGRPQNTVSALVQDVQTCFKFVLAITWFVYAGSTRWSRGVLLTDREYPSLVTLRVSLSLPPSFLRSNIRSTTYTLAQQSVQRPARPLAPAVVRGAVDESRGPRTRHGAATRTTRCSSARPPARLLRRHRRRFVRPVARDPAQAGPWC